ncbi:NupC/NupG family nucleoside CNT transporter [Elioraea sp.]|uniref:NupC/NupG family nucleoside CNT transporter n=1 Tax=Elioraea sp. TaxID=2185103 RepID=UPI0025BE1E16|nr:nucleoside transporter C-terminal domain-containing protein [Elioraea sp.]
MSAQAVSAFGLVALAALAWAWGRVRGPAAIPWRLVIIGLAAQVVLAAAMLHLPPLRAALGAVGGAVDVLARATTEGTSLVFGYLGGGPLPFVETAPGASFILAFRALPLILVVGALAALLYHLGILPLLVRGMAALLSRGFGLGGAAGFATAANVFVGMVEAPLLVRPYLAALPRADLFVVMVAGLATISGNTLAVYALFLRDVLPDAAGQLLAASLVSAPAAVLVARLMLPAEADATVAAEQPPPRLYAGAMEAIVRGTADGLAIMLGVIAALIVFIALVALANAALVPLTGVTLQAMAAWLMRPMALLIGIPVADAVEAGRLLGLKLVINEFVAYLEFGTSGAALSERSRIILVWALCGFANPGSMGIIVGGMSTLVPERRGEIAALGPPALVGGTLACCMTGAAVGILIPA